MDALKCGGVNKIISKIPSQMTLWQLNFDILENYCHSFANLSENSIKNFFLN